MRVILLLLFAGNLAALAWWQGWLDEIIDSGREPARMARQLEPARLEVLPASALSAPATTAGSSGTAVPRAVRAAVSSPSSVTVEAKDSTRVAVPPRERPPPAPTPEPTEPKSPQPAADAAPATADKKPAPEPVQACVEFSTLDGVRAERLSSALVAAGMTVSRVSEESTGGYVVYIPPFPTLAQAQARVAELRELGVRERDIYLLPDGPYRLGIALGVFRNRASSMIQLRQLQSRGVVGAIIGYVNPAAARVVLRANGASDALAEQASRLAQDVGAEVGVCR